MKTALTNIIVNAIEAMDFRQGELKLVTMSVAGKYVVLIEDNGCGISEKSLRNIFKKSCANEACASGFGLLSAYKILASNHVKFHVESQQGLGTRFVLLFDKSK